MMGNMLGLGKSIISHNGANAAPIMGLSITEVTASHVNVLLGGQSTGVIVVLASGGTNPYQYKKGSGSYGASATFNNLSATTYRITVKDATNATAYVDIEITEPDPLTIMSIQTTDVGDGVIYTFSDEPDEAYIHGNADNFSIKINGNPVNNVGYIKASKIITIYQDVTIAFGDTVTTSYDSSVHPLYGTGGGLLASFTGSPVDLVNIPDPYCHFISGSVDEDGGTIHLLFNSPIDTNTCYFDDLQSFNVTALLKEVEIHAPIYYQPNKFTGGTQSGEIVITLDPDSDGVIHNGDFASVQWFENNTWTSSEGKTLKPTDEIQLTNNSIQAK